MILQSQCASLFGDPTAKAGRAKNVVRVPVPWNMSMGPTPIQVIPINKVAADSLAAVIKKIWDRCDHAQGAIHHAGCDCFQDRTTPAGGRSVEGRLSRCIRMPWLLISMPRRIRWGSG